jgi:hypothetical protein
MTMRGTLAASGVGFVVLACGGQSSGAQCSCADPSVFVDIPSDLAAAVSAVQLSGVACSAVSAACVAPVGRGCAQLTFRASAAGSCTIDVEFSSGPPAFEAVRRFAALPCCKGFYAEPLEGATITVPDPYADSGTDG